MDTSGSKPQGKTIKLHISTLDRIDKLKHKGQTYDGVINELIDFHDSQLASPKNQRYISKAKIPSKTRSRKKSGLTEANN
jgi:hypothetical protein